MAFTWHKPTVISKEESRESATYGVLPTPDEIKEVIVPENGVILVGYSAKFKSSVSSAGAAAIFLGANQLREYTTEPTTIAAGTIGTTFRNLTSSWRGLTTASAGEALGADVTTGQTIGSSLSGGLAAIFLAAGTYNVSVQFKSTTGKVVAKERRLWVGVPE